MPLETIIVLAVVFSLFGGFILIVGGASLWVALGERRPRRRSSALRPAAMRARRAMAARI